MSTIGGTFIQANAYLSDGEMSWKAKEVFTNYSTGRDTYFMYSTAIGGSTRHVITKGDISPLKMTIMGITATQEPSPYNDANWYSAGTGASDFWILRRINGTWSLMESYYKNFQQPWHECITHTFLDGTTSTVEVGLGHYTCSSFNVGSRGTFTFVPAWTFSGASESVPVIVTYNDHVWGKSYVEGNYSGTYTQLTESGTATDADIVIGTATTAYVYAGNIGALADWEGDYE